jgi:NhaP-type Na+/H+ or K+/H+ antiporter
MQALGKEMAFRDEYFFALLLPPIVFSVGYSIRKAYFFENIGLIVFLGVVATVITVCLFALLLITANSAFALGLNSRDILQLATVMASIDPISALPLIRETHGRLSAVVSGESVVNSAVVIILFGTVSSLTA